MEYNNNLEATNRKFMEAIGDLNGAFLDERDDIVYYEYLSSKAPTDGQKEIINFIVNKERIHARLLRRLYKELSGIDISFNPNETIVMPQSYLDGIKKAINRELREIERYKAIREGFPIGPYRDVLSGIIADELSHASKFNYLLALNSNMNTPSMNENYVKRHTDNFTLDDWARLIKPLVSRVLAEYGDVNSVTFFRKLILSGILIGLGKRPLEAIELVERWEQNGTSDLLYFSD